VPCWNAASPCDTAPALLNCLRAMFARAMDRAREIGSSSLTVIALRSLAEQAPLEQREPLLQEALRLARQTHRRLDKAACLLSLSALKDGQEQRVLWKQRPRLLDHMGAAAWAQGVHLKTRPQFF